MIKRTKRTKCPPSTKSTKSTKRPLKYVILLYTLYINLFIILYFLFYNIHKKSQKVSRSFIGAGWILIYLHSIFLRLYISLHNISLYSISFSIFKILDFIPKKNLISFSIFSIGYFIHFYLNLYYLITFYFNQY